MGSETWNYDRPTDRRAHREVSLPITVDVDPERVVTEGPKANITSKAAKNAPMEELRLTFQKIMTYRSTNLQTDMRSQGEVTLLKQLSMHGLCL